MKYLHYKLEFFKNQAKNLKKHLKPVAKLTSMNALDIVACAHGFSGWNELYRIREIDALGKIQKASETSEIRYLNEMPFHLKQACLEQVWAFISLNESVLLLDESGLNDLKRFFINLYHPVSNLIYNDLESEQSDKRHEFESVYGSMYMIGEKNNQNQILRQSILTKAISQGGVLLINESQTEEVQKKVGHLDKTKIIDLRAESRTPLQLFPSSKIASSTWDLFYRSAMKDGAFRCDMRVGLANVLIECLLDILKTPTLDYSPAEFLFELDQIQAILSSKSIKKNDKDRLIDVLTRFGFVFIGDEIIKDDISCECLDYALLMMRAIAKQFAIEQKDQERINLATLFDCDDSLIILITSNGKTDNYQHAIENSFVAGVFGLFCDVLDKKSKSNRETPPLKQQKKILYASPDTIFLPVVWGYLLNFHSDKVFHITTSEKYETPDNCHKEIEYTMARALSTNVISIGVFCQVELIKTHFEEMINWTRGGGFDIYEYAKRKDNLRMPLSGVGFPYIIIYDDELGYIA